MIVFLEKDKEQIKLYTSNDGHNIIVKPKNGVPYSIHESDFEKRYNRLISEGYVDVTKKYFICLIKGQGDFCIIEDIHANETEYRVINSNSSNFTCGKETAKRTYQEKINEGYIEATDLYNYKEDAPKYKTQKQEKYMFGLDRAIESIPLPDFYKETIFAAFKK